MPETAAIPAPGIFTAVALTTGRLSDVEEINKLLSDGVLVLLTPVTQTAATPQRGDSSLMAAAEVVRVGQLEINLVDHVVRWQGNGLDLSEREIAILACLGRDIGRAYSFAELFKRAWGNSCHIDTLVIHSAIQRIRRKLADSRVPLTIESVRGYGFRIASGRRVVAASATLTGST